MFFSKLKKNTVTSYDLGMEWCCVAIKIRNKQYNLETQRKAGNTHIHVHSHIVT